MKYPYGYCGMPCALCTRYRTNGKSQCHGCSFGGFYTDVCKVHHCCCDKKLNHCGNCEVFPCIRLGKMGDFRDLNTNNAKGRTCADVSSDGFDNWFSEYCARADLLTIALDNYNDGRMKRYLCELFIQNQLPTLTEIMLKAKTIPNDADKGKQFKALVQSILGEKV